MNKKKVLIIAGIVVVALVVVFLNMKINTTKTTKVQAEVATPRELVEKVSASGRIQPQTKVNITSQVNGEIIALPVKEGNYVKTGDLLVVLDTVQLRSDVDQASYAVAEINARVTGAKAQLDQAKEEFDRQTKLFDRKLTSETSYNDAKYTYQNLKASYDAMTAQAKQSEAMYEKQLDNLSKAKIVAPMSGIVTFLDCEVGEIAAAQTAFTQGKTLMTISNLDVFEVEVDVDETEINKVALNQPVDIEVDAFPDSTFPGQVVEIGNTAIVSGSGTQDQSTDFAVKVIFTDPNVKIRPGMSATVDIITNKKPEALAVPYSAIVVRSFDLDSLEKAKSGVADSGSEASASDLHAADSTSATKVDDEEDRRKELKGVFVIHDGTAKFRQVETGIADQRNIEITSGLAKGDSVVSGPYKVLRTIKDGDAVEPTKDLGVAFKKD
jgi:HlyD family secretion protein